MMELFCQNNFIIDIFQGPKYNFESIQKQPFADIL